MASDARRKLRDGNGPIVLAGYDAGMVDTRTPTATVNTGRVANRRNLRFNAIDDVLADIERLVEAERAGGLNRLGNWTLGQNLGHLASWVNYAFDGYPMRTPPFPMRWILKLRKNKYIHGRMPAGVKIPGVQGGTCGTEALSNDEGLQRYRAALERLRNSAPQQSSPIFGPLSHEEWIALNLRHAELHLGFFLVG